MNRFNLLINLFAEQDIRISKKWYDLQKENLGNDFISEVEKTLESIQQNPFQFQQVQGEIRRALIKNFHSGYIISLRVILLMYLLFFILAEILKSGNHG